MNLKTIIIKLKKHIKVDGKKVFDHHVAKALCIPSETFTSQKYRNSIPYFEIINFCKKKNIDLNEIFKSNLWE